MVRLSLLLIAALLLVACGGATGPEDGASPESAAELSPTVEPSPPTTGPEILTNDGVPRLLEGAAARWETDFTRSTIDLNELLSGGPPRDGIAPIDAPLFLTVEEAAAEVQPDEPVVSFGHEGEVRAYPLAILTWHEIVNDEVGGLPVTITFCPLCNSAIAFDRTLNGQVLDFGTSGLLRNSDLVMWDRQTESLWQQLTGEGIVGQLAGEQLTFLPASIISFDEFRTAFPDGMVLSRETGHRRAYGRNPYEFYDSRDRPFGFFDGTVDERLPGLERVVGLEIGEVAVAYPFSALEGAGVINDEVAGQPIALFYTPDTTSALAEGQIASARAVGSAVPFDPRVDGERLTFALSPEGDIIDEQSGSTWDITGRALSGPMAGQQLGILPHANHFWFAFAAFFPEVEIRGVAAGQ